MLPIFPEGGLTSSVITTVWVGVFVIAFFNLRFGWVLSGLVVPGYLVPLLIVRPIAAVVITVEAVICYALVWLVSERLGKGRWSSFFGRDRFMALVLASIAVRLTFDGWLLPQLAHWLSANWGRQIDWESNLQSFGLVVISLLANQFWKPGLVRGLVATIVTVGITALIVRYGLMEFTNFRISGVSYMYEGLASSILASPKAYMILVMTAFIASQMNVRYGWDFSGILIPALIALQWYQPLKILSSFAEAGVIYFLAHAILKLPVMANVTVEGGRKLLLFFNISFAYKLLLGHALVLLAFDVRTNDFYGFGYLLATLLAIKAYDKSIFPRLARNTLEVSILGAAAGNLAGFALASLVPQLLPLTAANAAKSGQPANQLGGQIAAAVGDAYVRAAGAGERPFSPEEAADLKAAIELLEAGTSPTELAAALAGSGFQLSLGANGAIGIARAAGLGRDLVIFSPAARGRLAVIVPDAGHHPALALAGLAIFERQKARWLLLTPVSGQEPANQSTLLSLFRDTGRRPELTIVAEPENDGPKLALSGSGAMAIDLANLRAMTPGLTIQLDPGDGSAGARLSLGPASAERMLGSPPISQRPQCKGLAAGPPKGNLLDLAALAYLRAAVAEPAILALINGRTPPNSAIAAARQIGFSVTPCLIDDRPHWSLEANVPGGGLFLFAENGNPARLIETSAGHDPEVVDAALAIHKQWHSGNVMIAHDTESLVGSQQTPFGVVSQAALRAIGDNPGELLQIRRAIGILPAPQGADMVISPDWLEAGQTEPSQLIRLAKTAGFSPAMVDRGQASAGFEVVANLSLRYLEQTRGKRAATFWLPRVPDPETSE